MVWRVLGSIGLGASLLGGCESVPVSESTCGDLGRLQQPFTGGCFRKQLEPVADPARADFGQVPCRVATVAHAGAPECDCQQFELAEADESLANFARSRLSSSGTCEGECCDNLCLCELPQLQGSDLQFCWDVEAEARPYDEVPVGWCYVEPDAGFGNPELVGACRADERRLLRVVPNSSFFIVLMCQG